MKSYDPGQVIAVLLRELKPARAQFEVKTKDDSLFLVNSLQIEEDTIILQDAALRGLRISVMELVN